MEKICRNLKTTKCKLQTNFLIETCSRNLKTTKCKLQTNFLIEIYFHGKNVEKRKKEKIVLTFTLFVNCYHFSLPEELRISDFFFSFLQNFLLRY